MRRIIPTNRLGGLAGLTAVAFLVLAPIYRFPAVPGQLIALIKLTLFFGAIALSSVVLWKRRDLAGGLKIVVSFAIFLVAASIVGLVQSDTSGAIRHLQTIVWPALGLLIGFSVWQYFAETGLRYYAIAMTVVAAAAWLCSALWYHDVGGLAYLRTGWSGSLAYASVIALVLMGLSTTARSMALWGGCYAIITSSQLYLGGRAGLFFPIAAYLIVLMVGFLGPRVRNGVITLAIFGAIVLAPAGWSLARSVISASPNVSVTAKTSAQQAAPAKPKPLPEKPKPSPIDAVEAQLRIVDKANSNYVSVLDRITSGRIGLIYEAIDLIEQRPLTGWGFTDHRKTGLWKDSIVHNEWLKAWYQGGPLYVAGVTLVFLSLAFFAWRTDGLSPTTGFPPIFSVIVLCQFFTSMVEPNSIIGVFYKSSPLWVLLGAATWIETQYGRAEHQSIEAAA